MGGFPSHLVPVAGRGRHREDVVLNTTSTKVIIAAVVGGVVGSRNHHNNSTDASGKSSSDNGSSDGSSAGQAAAASSAASVQNALGLVPTATNSLYLIPIYPSTVCFLFFSGRHLVDKQDVVDKHSCVHHTYTRCQQRCQHWMAPRSLQALQRQPDERSHGPPSSDRPRLQVGSVAGANRQEPIHASLERYHLWQRYTVLRPR